MAARILVAEDNCAHAKVMRFILTTAGYEVTVAVDGRQAWMAAQREQFDIVITDYKMPDLTGIELCQLLRQDRDYANVPIILVSSFCRELQMDLVRTRFYLSAVCEKPVAFEELVHLVESSLESPTAAAAC